MNVTELARKLKIPTSDLKNILPRLGFDIGRKAIKVDDKSAQKIIDKVKLNPQLIEKLLTKDEIVEEKITVDSDQQPEITIPPVITVRDFAALLEKPVAIIIQELMKNGILANLNEQIDYETAHIISEDFGFKTKVKEEEKKSSDNETTINQLISDDKKDLVTRPPIVVVMGHVDHGKTQLLDSIRKTNIIAKESGGITQHIGAYQVEKNNKKITFIDTPGHEAFTAMRSRGARVADIAILLIAADDGIKPQTEEVIQIIENAKIPFIVAINKIDKPESDIEKVKQQLAQKNLLPEDWGGKIITVPVSAKTGQGIDDLLENLLLLADVERENIQADPNQSAVGTIIESHIDKGEGAVATAIILSGTLKPGAVVQVGNVVGKIRAMKDDTGKIIKSAPPSMPVKILGLKDIPDVGDILQTPNDQQSLKKMMKKIKYDRKIYQDKQKWQIVKTKENDEEDKVKSLKIIIKSDALGSQEAILQSLEVLQLEDIKIKIVKKGLGNINDEDVLQAESINSLLFGFNVKTESRAKEIAMEKNITIHLYNVIYDLIDHVKKEVDKLIDIKKEKIELGKIKILAVFRTEKSNMIVGGQVTKGKVEADSFINIFRDKILINTGQITKLQQSKIDVQSVPSGSECGLQIKTSATLQEGDILEAYKEELVKATPVPNK